MTLRKVSTVVFVAYAIFFTWGAIGITGNGCPLWARAAVLWAPSPSASACASGTRPLAARPSS